VKRNEVLKKEAKEKGVKLMLRRQPPGPRPGLYVSTKGNAPETVTPVPFEFLV
jgi:large subunit ribosomal protein L21e